MGMAKFLPCVRMALRVKCFFDPRDDILNRLDIGFSPERRKPGGASLTIWGYRNPPRTPRHHARGRVSVSLLLTSRAIGLCALPWAWRVALGLRLGIRPAAGSIVSPSRDTRPAALRPWLGVSIGCRRCKKGRPRRPPQGYEQAER